MYIYILVIFTIRSLFILERCHIRGGEDNFQLSFYYIDPGDPTWSSDLVAGNIAYWTISSVQATNFRMLMFVFGKFSEIMYQLGLWVFS